MNKLFIIGVIIAGACYMGGQYISSDPVRNADRSITVQGTGTAKSVPDIAHISLGVRIQPQPTAKEATDMLAKQGNAVIAAVKNLDIAEADIKTENISVQPFYAYESGKQILRGYEGSEQLDITVRKTDQAGDVIARATEAGANQIGGVTFKSDNPEANSLTAEKDAIDNARKNAEELAASLGVRLGKVKQYNVSRNSPGPVPYALEAKDMVGNSVTSPDLPVGTQENSVTVSITYEIR